MTNPEKNSLWSRYKNSIDFKSDLHQIYFRSHSRYATLDGARAFTILLLVLFHVLYGIVRLVDDHLQAFFESFPPAFNWMWQTQGSDPLFVISGLLVSYTIFREHDQTNTINLLRFYQRRMLRIYPLFLLAILIYLPTSEKNWDYLLSNLLFISNYIPDHRTIVPVTWSLEAQMQYYLLLPILCFVVYMVRWRIALLVGLVIAALVYRYWIVIGNPVFYETPLYQVYYDRDFGRLMSDNLYYDLDVRIGGFLMGTLVAYLHHYYGPQMSRYFNRHLIINAILMLSALGMIYYSFSYPLLNGAAEFYDNFDAQSNLWYLAMNRYIYSLGMSLLMLLALCPAGISKIVNWFLSWPVWHSVAQLIYPIYLFHFVFIVAAAVLVFGTTDRDSITSVSIYQIFAIYFFAVIFTMMFASLVHIFIEKPFLKLRRK